MHWNELKDDDLICAFSQDGTYLIDKKVNINKANVIFKKCYKVKPKIVYYTVDEVRSFFEDEMIGYFIFKNLLLEKMDFNRPGDYYDQIEKSIRHARKETCKLGNLVELTSAFNKYAKDLKFYEREERIYFDEKHGDGGNRTAMINVDEGIIEEWQKIKGEE